MRILYIDTPEISKLNGVKYYRMLVPMKELEKRGHTVKVTNELAVKDKDGNMSLIGDDIEWCDIIVLPRYFDNSPNVIVSIVQYAKSLGKVVVYETDDYLHEIPEHNQAAEKVNLEENQKLIEFLEKEADIVTCTTRRLAELLDGEICPNSVDMELWGDLINQKKPGKFRIGWSGGWTHKKDLEMIVPVIKKLKEKYKFEFIIHGFDPEIPKTKLYYKFYQQVRVLDYPESIASLGLDIAIAPLVDDEFNQYKSNIKWLEASMVGIPFVASNLPPYEMIKDGENGFLATTPHEWYEKLETLILDEGLRARIAQKAREHIIENYDIKKTIQCWIDVYQKGLDKCQK
jgi:glycosyltransferase involved in cell wall biosynthesis